MNCVEISMPVADVCWVPCPGGFTHAHTYTLLVHKCMFLTQCLQHPMMNCKGKWSIRGIIPLITMLEICSFLLQSNYLTSLQRLKCMNMSMICLFRQYTNSLWCTSQHNLCSFSSSCSLDSKRKDTVSHNSSVPFPFFPIHGLKRGAVGGWKQVLSQPNCCL